MTVEELRAELEKITIALLGSGFYNINTAGTVEKLGQLAVTAGGLNMKEGKRLIENLSEAIKGIQDGKTTVDSGNLRLTALDFYLKKHSASGTVEEL